MLIVIHNAVSLCDPMCCLFGPERLHREGYSGAARGDRLFTCLTLLAFDAFCPPGQALPMQTINRRLFIDCQVLCSFASRVCLCKQLPMCHHRMPALPGSQDRV